MTALRELVARPPLLEEQAPLEVVTHVGRDILANAAYFATIPKAVYEYVSNAVDATPPGRACTVRVTTQTRGPVRRIVVVDDASGMGREMLRLFFTMHGENVLRRAGRKVRGRFGTGKIAAFGRADVLRVDTVQEGLRNVVELRRGDLEGVQPGQPIRVRELLVDEPVATADVTTVTIEELHRGTRVDRGDIARYLQRQLGRHLAQHRVYVDGERVRYAEPESHEAQRFAAPAQLAERAGAPLELVVKVAARPLAEEENGIAILCNGFLNAMTLAGLNGKQEAEYLFGELEVAALDDDDAPIPAFLATRDLTLNPENPLVAELVPWVRACLETVRRELVRRAQARRRAAEQRELERLGSDIGSLLNQMWRGERSRLVPAAPEPAAPAPAEEPSPPALALTRAPRRDKGIPRGPRPARPPEPQPAPPPPPGATVPSLREGSGAAGFRVAFRNVGEANLRAFYVREERAIVLNLDHPEAVASLALGGPTSPFFAHFAFRMSVEEFTLAMVSELGYPDAPEIAQEIRERADKYSRAFAPNIERLAVGEPASAGRGVSTDGPGRDAPLTGVLAPGRLPGGPASFSSRAGAEVVRDRLEQRDVVRPEGRELVGVDVDLPNDLPAVPLDRHDDLRPRGGEAGDVAGILRDVGDDLRPS